MPLILVSTLLVIGLILTIRGIVKYVLLFTTPISSPPMENWWLGNPFEPSIIELGLTTLFLIVGWALATRVIAFQKPVFRFGFGILMVMGIFFQYIWTSSAPVYTEVFPFFLNQLELIDPRYTTFKEVMVADINGLLYLLLSLPLVISVLVMFWLGNLYTQYQHETNEFVRTWKISLPKFKNFFDRQEVSKYPDVELGANIKTKEMVLQKGKDRTLNNVIIGPIGSGKTSALVLPMISNDLKHMARMINGLPEAYEQEDFHSEDVKGNFLNGITVVEPSNDLCQKTYKLALAHDIPEEAIYYIDPTNPNTKSINPLHGPTDKVAETFVQVIEGIGKQTEFFFEQSQRVHLKHYVYLLKLHDPEAVPTFDDLIDMYNNAQLVHHMHVRLKQTIPENINYIEDRDERNHWKIVKGIDEWFDASLAIKEERKGAVSMKVRIEDESSPYNNEYEYFDTKETFVVGLRNILNDISANKLVRRVLFGHSDFSFDTHLEVGGLLIVNTAKGELGGLSDTIGRFVVLMMQNAVFRREPNVSPFHSMIIDEFPDYITEPFASFPAQSRKYKAIITIVAQTVAQLSREYSDDFLHTLLATCRHKFCYGDVDEKTATLFSSIFGEKDEYKESGSEQSVSSMLDGSTMREGFTTSKEREVIMSPSDIIFQDKFVCAVKLVEDNKPIQVQQIQANFVPREEFTKASILADREKGIFWLQKRKEWADTFNAQDNYERLDEEAEEILTEDVPPEELYLNETPIVEDSNEEEVVEVEEPPLLELNRGSSRPRTVISTVDEVTPSNTSTAVLDPPAESSTASHRETNDRIVNDTRDDDSQVQHTPKSKQHVDSMIIDDLDEEEAEKGKDSVSQSTNRVLSVEEALLQEKESSQTSSTSPKSGSHSMIDDDELSADELNMFKMFPGETEKTNLPIEANNREISEPDPLFEQEIERHLDSLNRE